MTNYRWAGVTAASTEWSSGHGKRRIVIFGKNHFRWRRKPRKPLGERKGRKFLKEERMASLIEGD